MAPKRFVSEDELEGLVAKRLSERKEIISEAVEALRPELDKMADQIADANHVKQELAVEIRELTTAVQVSQQALSEHVRQPAHVQGVELINELGLEGLSLEQKAALPGLLKRAAAGTDSRRSRAELWSFMSHFIGSLAAASGTALAILGYLHATGALH